MTLGVRFRPTGHRGSQEIGGFMLTTWMHSLGISFAIHTSPRWWQATLPQVRFDEAFSSIRQGSA